MQIKQFFQSKAITSWTTVPRMPRAIPHKGLRYLIQIGGWGILALFPVYCFLMTEYIK